MFSGVRGSVRAVSIASCDSDPYDIILDSGSDATVLPTSLIHAGVASKLSFSMPKASRSAFQMSGTPFSNFILKMAV